MNELTVLVEQSGEIKFSNFEEIKANLTEKMEEYRTAVFTDESIPDAKKYVASLRKLSAAVDSRRKEVKAAYLQPYQEFEAKVKELTDLINEPIVFINGQVKDFEERQRAEKKEKIVDLYKEIAADVEEYIPLSKIYDPKWENKGMKLSAVEKELVNYADSARQAVQTLTSMNSEAFDRAIAVYKGTLNLSEAIQVITQFELQKAEILRKEQERKQQEEIERVKREERARVAEEERIKQEERNKVLAEQESKKEAEKEAMSIQQEHAGEKVVKAQYIITGFASEFGQVEMYLDSIGVAYERVM